MRLRIAAAGLAYGSLIAGVPAHAYYGTFDPQLHEYSGPQLVTVVDTDAAPVHCVRLAAQSGDMAQAMIGLVLPMVACTHEKSDECTIVAPVKAGVGTVIAVAGLMASPDAMLGHELRHCRDRHYHPVALPFADHPGEGLDAHSVERAQ
jgi:hypothetical protein